MSKIECFKKKNGAFIEGHRFFIQFAICIANEVPLLKVQKQKAKGCVTCTSLISRKYMIFWIWDFLIMFSSRWVQEKNGDCSFGYASCRLTSFLLNDSFELLLISYTVYSSVILFLHCLLFFVQGDGPVPSKNKVCGCDFRNLILIKGHYPLLIPYLVKGLRLVEW